MELGQRVRYRRHRGWDGRIWMIRMTEEEIRAREAMKLIASIAIVVPGMILLMAAAAGMI